jgi:hypothetical protein
LNLWRLQCNQKMILYKTFLFAQSLQPSTSSTTQTDPQRMIRGLQIGLSIRCRSLLGQVPGSLTEALYSGMRASCAFRWESNSITNRQISNTRGCTIDCLLCRLETSIVQIHSMILLGHTWQQYGENLSMFSRLACCSLQLSLTATEANFRSAKHLCHFHTPNLPPPFNSFLGKALEKLSGVWVRCDHVIKPHNMQPFPFLRATQKKRREKREELGSLGCRRVHWQPNDWVTEPSHAVKIKCQRRKISPQISWTLTVYIIGRQDW